MFDISDFFRVFFLDNPKISFMDCSDFSDSSNFAPTIREAVKNYLADFFSVKGVGVPPHFAKSSSKLFWAQ